MRRGESGMSFALGVDKPSGPSSHDAVGRVRRCLRERRVGHAGTLDPLASGVLVVGVGQATRLLGLLTLDDKRYEATVVFGTQTSTDDAEGEAIAVRPVSEAILDADFARSTVATLVGEFDQVPPAYSAVSVDGKRSYARARAGESFELAARRVRVHEAELVSVVSGPEPLWVIRLHVSKGTYVRSIARDLGTQLGCGAHLGALRRLASGRVAESDCVALEDLEAVGPALALARCLDPAELLGYPTRQLTGPELEDLRCGRRIEVGVVSGMDGEPYALDEGGRVCLVRDQRLFGVWHRSAGMLVPESSFLDGIVGVRQ